MSAAGESALYNLAIEACRDPLTDQVDPEMIEAYMNIVPRDSGIQNVSCSIHFTLARARRFKEPFRSYAIQMAKGGKIGLKSISSERGAFMREFNTNRASIPIGGSEGPEYTFADKYLHEEVLGKKGFFKNNKEKPGLGFDE